MNTFILGLALSIMAPAPKEKAKDPPKIDGDWVVETFEGAPKEVPPGALTFRFADGIVSVKENAREKPEDASYTVDLKKKPATIDIRPGQGPKEEVVQGIFEFKDDKLRLCFSRDGKERPKEFKGDPANGIMMLTLKRLKPEK